MGPSRGWHGLVSSNGFLFAIGGSDGLSKLNTVEKFDPKTDGWIKANPMVLHRKGFGMASLDCPDQGKFIPSM